MSSSKGGGIGIGTILFLAWIFGAFDGCDEDKTPSEVNVAVEESKPSTSIKSELKGLVKEVKKEANRIREEFTSSETENKEVEETGTMILVKPETDKKEAEKTDIEEEQLPEVEEDKPMDEELNFTPL